MRKAKHVKETLQEELKKPHFRETYELEKIKAEIALEIVKFRQHKNLTQAKLAKLAGLKQQEISRIENGDFDTLRILYKVLSVLGRGVKLTFPARRDLQHAHA